MVTRFSTGSVDHAGGLQDLLHVVIQPLRVQEIHEALKLPAATGSRGGLDFQTRPPSVLVYPEWIPKSAATSSPAMTVLSPPPTSLHTLVDERPQTAVQSK